MHAPSELTESCSTNGDEETWCVQDKRSRGLESCAMEWLFLVDKTLMDSFGSSGITSSLAASALAFASMYES